MKWLAAKVFMLITITMSPYRDLNNCLAWLAVAQVELKGTTIRTAAFEA